jgi:hypothetical protein
VTSTASTRALAARKDLEIIVILRSIQFRSSNGITAIFPRFVAVPSVPLPACRTMSIRLPTASVRSYHDGSRALDRTRPSWRGVPGQSMRPAMGREQELCGRPSSKRGQLGIDGPLHHRISSVYLAPRIAKGDVLTQQVGSYELPADRSGATEALPMNSASCRNSVNGAATTSQLMPTRRRTSGPFATPQA